MLRMMDQQVKNLVKAIFPPGDVSDEPEDILAYGFDATGKESAPELVAFPRSPEQVSQTLKLANERGFTVTARGAGTGFVGASIPVRHGVALVMTRMNRILEIDRDNFTALVEPGLVTGRFQKEVEKLGLFYPPDPASLNVSTLGGNIAMGAGGPRAVKYGVTKDYALGLEVVLPTGEIIQTGAQTVKSVVGYDFTRLMVGSEGTLGIITKIRLRLLPKPETARTMLAMFDSVNDAAMAVARITKEGIIPRTLEFMDKNSIQAVEKYIHAGLPANAEALLLIETDGAKELAEKEINIIKDICSQLNSTQLRVAKDETERETLWKTRRSLSQAISRISPTKINEDITVPRSKIPDLISKLSELADKVNLPIVNFGHAGDGNIHVNVMTDKNNKEEYARALGAVDEIFAICLGLGGTISGEHGIGLEKARYLESEVGKAGIDLIKRVKIAFDPNNILNPGKITPEGA
ncbi:Glycolate dehydrogenase, subunit GlcD [hydrothermal vent metagenome]|uniref:Glycolate dehydrogenase, subunit GlcD n=1 Tax=hydrothermal vent metagenome TaxID=652676 RepID=A0A3B1C3U2_9ZZZZ